MESLDEKSTLFLSKCRDDERLAWRFLISDDLARFERAWLVERHVDEDERLLAWGFGPLAAFSEQEEFRIARMRARLQIWQDAYGDSKPTPYGPAQTKAIGMMFDDYFARRVGLARSHEVKSAAEKELLSLSSEAGNQNFEANELGRKAMLLCCREIAPERAGFGPVAVLAERKMTAEAKNIANRHLGAKVNPGER